MARPIPLLVAGPLKKGLFVASLSQQGNVGHRKMLKERKNRDGPDILWVGYPALMIGRITDIWPVEVPILISG